MFEEPSVGDAFGQMLLDFLTADPDSGPVLEVVERGDGLVRVGDPARYFDGPDDWSSLERWGCGFANGRVLDIGAGAGRHSLHLQDLGSSVTALDVSPLAIETCQRRGVTDAFVGSIEDLATISDLRFDTFLLLGNNLGLLRSPEYAPSFFEVIDTLAAPGAVVIGHGHDPYQTESPVHRQYHEMNRAHGRMAGQTLIRIRYERTATEWFDYLFASRAELESLLLQTSWQISELREEQAQYVAILTYRS